MKSILPICDEFIVVVGDSKDETLKLIESIGDSRIAVFQTHWSTDKGPEVLSEQTNIALSKCSGDWAFYIQADEVIHEDDLPKLKKLMEDHLDDRDVDALRFRHLHFYGSYYRYRIDKGWYQKQDRIIRNNQTIESYGDAFAFRRKDGKPLRSLKTGCLLYHYGWVHPEGMMTQRRINAENIGFTTLMEDERKEQYDYGDLSRFPVYFGTHPLVMREIIKQHPLSQKDLEDINRKFWWQPLKWFKIRYKTGRRVKEKIK